MDAFQQYTAVGAERRILLHVLDVHRCALDRGAAEMGLAQPDPPFARSAATRSALMPKADLGTKTSSVSSNS